jgi:anaerobic magnesium-protoporphyrin IX monomethyl ester cyclase
MNILFINPPSVPYSSLVKALKDKTISHKQTLSLPLGILYLSSVLEKNVADVDIKIIDIAKGAFEHSRSTDRLSTNIVGITALCMKDLPDDWVPDYIGISVLFSTAHKTTCEISKSLKKIFPGRPIVVGGMHATNAVEKLLKFESIDYVCRGEGESIIVEFSNIINSCGDVEKIQGVYGRSKLKNNQIGGLNESAPLVENIDEIPFPAWHLISMNDYIVPSGRARRVDTVIQDGEATIMTTRGCPFFCTFCSSWTVHGRKMRYRSIENVMEEIDILYHKYNVRSFVPEDDLFTVKKERIINLCNSVSSRYKDLKFQFPNGLSVATLDDDVIAAMIRMGMTVATIAIESGSDFVQRKIIKKNASLTRAKKVVQSCRDQGVIVRCYYVLGFPGETKEMIEETVNFSASVSSDWSVYNIASPLSGTEMFETLLNEGTIGDDFNWDDSFYQDRFYDSPEITADELKVIAHRANITNNFFHNYNLRIEQFDRAILLFEDILHSYPEHLAARYCYAIAHKHKGDIQHYKINIKACEDLIINGENDSFTRDLYRDFIDEFVELDYMKNYVLNKDIKGSNRNHDKTDEQPRHMRSI